VCELDRKQCPVRAWYRYRPPRSVNSRTAPPRRGALPRASALADKAIANQRRRVMVFIACSPFHGAHPDARFATAHSLPSDSIQVLTASLGLAQSCGTACGKSPGAGRGLVWQPCSSCKPFRCEGLSYLGLPPRELAATSSALPSSYWPHEQRGSRLEHQRTEDHRLRLARTARGVITSSRRNGVPAFRITSASGSVNSSIGPGRAPRPAPRMTWPCPP